VPQKPKSPLEQNYYNLLQLVVRYGERSMEVEGTIYSIGEIIIYTLEGDEIQPPQPVYQTIIDEFKRHCKEPNFKAETFFKFHSDPAVSALAVDMIAEKYRDVAPKDETRLGELVTQLLYEIKLTVINMQIAELEASLKEAQASNDVDRQLLLLQHHPQLLAQRNEICKLLGNRVINI
jgi:DNA primase